jgi:hypothetical protein
MEHAEKLAKFLSPTHSLNGMCLLYLYRDIAENNSYRV